MFSFNMAEDKIREYRHQDQMPFLEQIETNQRPGWQRVQWLQDRLTNAEKQNAKQNDYYNKNEQSNDHILPYGKDSNSDSKSYDYVEDEYNFGKELESSLPYGIQNVRDVKHTRGTTTSLHAAYRFQPLCPSKSVTVYLNQEDDMYEYRPDQYEEVSCLYPFYKHHGDHSPDLRNKVCGQAGFSCIQLNRTIFLTRRNTRNSNKHCWETETRFVLAGCECMWPVDTFNDISYYHGLN